MDNLYFDLYNTFLNIILVGVAKKTFTKPELEELIEIWKSEAKSTFTISEPKNKEELINKLEQEFRSILLDGDNNENMC